MTRFAIFAVIAAMMWSQAASAFQIGPLGSAFESRLTNETEKNLTGTALKLGLLIKGPVHEEITQLAYGCPAPPSRLAKDDSCNLSDGPFANVFVIYGVRWNDIPPFKLNVEEGNCRYYGKRCNTSQTIRFSTQPGCWYCLFKDAERFSATKLIAGCAAGKNDSRGNLMTRSHFGDLQFLHGMADREKIPAAETQRDILGWIEFAWKVASKEISIGTKLKDVDIPTIKDHFGCTEWTVADLYILGRQDEESGLIRQVNKIAFGSVLHTVQDSFAAGHTTRKANNGAAMCGATTYPALPPIVEFHNYSAQDGTLHDHQDSRAAMAKGASEKNLPLAVEATRNLVDLFEAGAKWRDAREYVACVFELSPSPRSSSPGDAFKRR